MSDAKQDPKQVHRLTDMTVEEVSVVDRAANRRKFLLVKREGDMAIGSEVVQNADGSFTTKPAAAAPASGAPAATETTAPDATTKTAAKMPAEAATTFQEVVDGALDGLTKAKSLLTSGGETESIIDQLVTTADDIADAVLAFLGIEDPGNNNGVVPATEPAAPAGMGKRLEVRRAKRIVAKAEGEKAGHALVQKVGAKMAKDRLDRLQAAYAALGDILAEVLPKVVDDTQKAKGAPSAGVAEQGAGEKPATQPTVPEKKGTKKSVELPAEVQKALDDAAKTIKKQAEQLGALRNATQASNGAQVDVQKSRGEEVSWPLDMNEPVTAETAGKEFFG